MADQYDKFLEEYIKREQLTAEHIFCSVSGVPGFEIIPARKNSVSPAQVQSAIDSLVEPSSKGLGTPAGGYRDRLNAIDPLYLYAAVPKTLRFQMLASDNVVGIFPMTKELVKYTQEPLLSMSRDEINKLGVNRVPNMYYPAIQKEAPLEVKAAYCMLKDLSNLGIIQYNVPVGLYNSNNKLLEILLLGLGR